jgi:hypothetical protein
MTTAWFSRRTEDGNHQLLSRDLATGIDTPIGEPQPALFLLELLVERLETANREPWIEEPSPADWQALRDRERRDLVPPSGGLD